MSDIEKKEIFYIRHGDTSGGTCEDRDVCDIFLSDLGVKQALLTAQSLKNKRFDAILVSPLVRAVHTASIIAKELSGEPEIEIVPELIEKGTTPGYYGETIEYLKKYYKNIKMCTDKIFGDETGGFNNITDEDVTKRAKAVAEYLKNRFPYGTRILVVSHGSFGNAFLPASVGMAEGDFILSIFNTSVSKVKYTSDGKKRLSFVNDISHLSPIMPDYRFDV